MKLPRIAAIRSLKIEPAPREKKRAKLPNAPRQGDPFTPTAAQLGTQLHLRSLLDVGDAVRPLAGVTEKLIAVDEKGTRYVSKPRESGDWANLAAQKLRRTRRTAAAIAKRGP